LIETKKSVNEKVDRQPDDHSKASVFITNHIIEIVVIEKRSKYLHNFKKCGKYTYVDMRTGEVKEYSDSNSINRNRSFTNLRRYINANFIGKPNEIFLTLTYTDPQFDRSQVSADFKLFWKKFKYRYKNCEYISIFEPHSNGNWHIHILIKDLQKKYLFIDLDECRRIWNHGFIKIIKLENNDNIGAYFTPGNNTNSNSSDSKNDRIKFYPRNSKCFTHSKNIKKPYCKIMSYEQAENMVKDSKEVFSENIGIYDGDEEVNTIFYRQYNSKRGK
jgi:geminivirus rep catalytic domain